MELLTPGLGLIFWQTVVFLFLVVVLGVFVWKPIIHALRAREDSIADALDAAELARQEMEQMKEDHGKLIKEAREERDKIIREATSIANKIKEEAKAETSKITAKMLEDARGTIQSEKNAALGEIKDQVAAFSLDVAEKILRKNLDNDKAQKGLVQDYLKDLKIN